MLWKAGSRAGYKATKETREKLRLSRLGKKLSDITKRRLVRIWERKSPFNYSFTSSSGKRFSRVRNLRKFAREHKDLSLMGLGLLWKGEIPFYNGWTKTNARVPIYEIISSKGAKLRGLILKELCRQAGLNYKSFHSGCIQRKGSYKGWTCRKYLDRI